MPLWVVIAKIWAFCQPLSALFHGSAGYMMGGQVAQRNLHTSHEILFVSFVLFVVIIVCGGFGVVTWLEKDPVH